MTKGNPTHQAGSQAQDWRVPLTGLERIRKAAERDSRTCFTSLMHHLTPGLLLASYNQLRKDAATGVDNVTWREYQDGLQRRLVDLHDRVQSGQYRATASKRIYIPKEDGRQRPIGIAALEDKIVQAAVVRILEGIYESDFVAFSYGFRPGRNQHNALDAINVGIVRRKVNWVLDADIRGFFDAIDHDWMMKFLEHRIADKRMLRLIGKWLKAGVSEEGKWSPTKTGTPQGAVISPLLANITLHYVVDLWVQWWRTKRAGGDVVIVRYADDFVMGFQHQSEARRFLNDLRERLTKFGLELNEEKTRLIEFGRFAVENRHRRGDGKPETFDFLGFTHFCSKTRYDGSFMVRRKPIAKRMRKKLREIKETLKRNRHKPVPEQGKWLKAVVQGYLNYFAVPGTARWLGVFRWQVCQTWLRALRRRSHKARTLPWSRFARLIDTWIPRVRILHPHPAQRLSVRPKVGAV